MCFGLIVDIVNKYYITDKNVVFNVLEDVGDSLFRVELLHTPKTHAYLADCDLVSSEFIDGCFPTTKETWKKDLVKEELKR